MPLHDGWKHSCPAARKGIRTAQPQPRVGERVQGLRQHLETLHHQAKSNLKNGGVGGGVSLWPAMDDMRLSKEDVWRLATVCVGLVAGTIAIFNFYHGTIHPCRHRSES